MRRLRRLLVALAVVACDPSAQQQPPPEPGRAAGAPIDRTGVCTIGRVVDGDTVVCSGERIRLLLVDAPEDRQQDLGLRARLALEELIPAGTDVRVETDVQPRDRYGRLLAHLHRDDGTWINRAMVRRGYAVVLVYPPNVRHVEPMRAAADSARMEGAGLWAERGFDCEPRDFRRGRCR